MKGGKMNKSIPVFVGVLLLVSMTLVAAKMPAAQNGLTRGKSNVQHLYLFEKNPETWDIVEEGAWGKLTFKSDGTSEMDKYVFNGHELVPEEDYTLIYYPDPWPGTGLICLGEATADMYGDVHVDGYFDFESIPIESDESEGAKIWLVSSSDVSCPSQEMVGWTPEEYLFEYDVINA